MRGKEILIDNIGIFFFMFLGFVLLIFVFMVFWGKVWWNLLGRRGLVIVDIMVSENEISI
jgi:hypothetical protein